MLPAVTSLASLNPSVIITLIALAVALTKIIEILVKKLIPVKKTLSDEEFNTIKGIDNKIKQLHSSIEDKATLSEQEHLWLHELHSLHDKTDGDGIPLWYIPRSFIEAQKDIADILNTTSSHHERTQYLLENLLKRLEKIEDTQRELILKNKD